MWLQSSDHKYMIVFQVITMGGKILISEFIKAAKLFMPLWFSDDANVSIFSGSDNTFSSIPSGWDHRGEKRAKKARKVNIATSFYIYIGSTILVEYYQPQTLSSFPPSSSSKLRSYCYTWIIITSLAKHKLENKLTVLDHTLVGTNLDFKMRGNCPYSNTVLCHLLYYYMLFLLICILISVHGLLIYTMFSNIPIVVEPKVQEDVFFVVAANQ